MEAIMQYLRTYIHEPIAVNSRTEYPFIFSVSLLATAISQFRKDGTGKLHEVYRFMIPFMLYAYAGDIVDVLINGNPLGCLNDFSVTWVYVALYVAMNYCPQDLVFNWCKSDQCTCLALTTLAFMDVVRSGLLHIEALVGSPSKQIWAIFLYSFFPVLAVELFRKVFLGSTKPVGTRLHDCAVMCFSILMAYFMGHTYMGCNDAAAGAACFTENMAYYGYFVYGAGAIHLFVQGNMGKMISGGVSGAKSGRGRSKSPRRKQ